eukprot:s616_g7.t1
MFQIWDIECKLFHRHLLQTDGFCAKNLFHWLSGAICLNSGGGLGRRWSPVAPRLFCVASVALGDICLRFVLQAWHLATSTFVLCGRRGTYSTGLVPVAALVAAGLLWRRAPFAWQAWHLATSALCFARQAWHLATSAFVLCGKRGTYGTGLALVAALVAGPLWRRASFAWQAWGLASSAFVLCGRRGTWRHLPSFCVAGVGGTYGTGLALVAALVAAGPCGAAPLLRGRRGTWRHLPSFCVEGVALGDICLRSPLVPCGAAFCVAGVALGDICLRFVRQAWHLATSAFVLCGRRGWHLRHWVGSGGGLGRRWSPVAPRLFCVAGVALGDICLRFVWQAWHLATWTFTLCGTWHLVASACFTFAWQEWHLRRWAGSLGPVCAQSDMELAMKLALAVRSVPVGARSDHNLAEGEWGRNKKEGGGR